jgi:putative PIN family toxin of toxin-antitoxin system
VIVVLDTNVIGAAMVAKGLCHEVVVRGLGSCTVMTSQLLLDELEYPLHTKFTLGPAAMAFLEQLRLRVRIVEPPLSAPVSRDADDDGVLATAVAVRASLIAPLAARPTDAATGPAGSNWRAVGSPLSSGQTPPGRIRWPRSGCS